MANTWLDERNAVLDFLLRKGERRRRYGTGHQIFADALEQVAEKLERAHRWDSSLRLDEAAGIVRVAIETLGRRHAEREP